jgi:hypothetical protein
MSVSEQRPQLGQNLGHAHGRRLAGGTGSTRAPVPPSGDAAVRQAQTLKMQA